LGFGVEFPIALFDAARPLVPGKRGADMVCASALACSGDFLSFRNFSVEIVRRDAALKTLCILENH
jgi:hypothetical protein